MTSEFQQSHQNCPHCCRSRRQRRAQLSIHTHTHQKEPKPHNKLLARGASHRVCGCSLVMMWFLKMETGRPGIPMRLRQSPAHVSSISFMSWNNTRLNAAGYQRGGGVWIYSGQGVRVLGRMLIVCVCCQRVKLWPRSRHRGGGLGVKWHSMRSRLGLHPRFT